MISKIYTNGVDALDMKALRLLQADGRATWASVAEVLQMTPPAAAERVRRLEEAGVIKGYTAIVEPSAVGSALTAFVAVTLSRPTHRVAFLERVRETPQVMECHHIAGDDDYFLKVRCSDVSDLERLVSNRVKVIPGVSRTRTVVVLRTEKETSDVPIAGAVK
jgi:Lrp/AsnC family leucine-responsive transcriptional regulator